MPLSDPTASHSAFGARRCPRAARVRSVVRTACRYNGGKMLAKLARLALIADELGRHADALALSQRLADQLEVLYQPRHAGAHSDTYTLTQHTH